MLGVFTVDVEDWYHPLDLPAQDWSALPARAHVGTEQLLDALDRHAARATFFVLGAVAERQPSLVSTIVERGHEVGTHGYAHERLERLSPAEFRDDLGKSIDILSDAGALSIKSYRAPCFSLGPETQWAVPILSDAGIETDSSLFPMRTGRYGVTKAEYDALLGQLRQHGITEVPIALPKYGPATVPLAGGFYCRFFPRAMTRAALRNVAARGDTPVFYVHPWELDCRQPRIALPWFLAFRHYLRLDATASIVDSVLELFPWTSAAEATAAATDRSD